MEEITLQSEFFHPFSLLFYNPKLPPFSTPVAHHNYEAGDQPCGRHAHIVAAEANRGERQQEGEREADAQVDEAGSCRDLDIAGSLQKTAGDVGDRAGPDEEHQDVEMFLCAPQGLSGDVEDLEKRPVKKQNYDTDGDTDQDAHQDGGAVAAAGTVQFFSADILSGEAGNGDVKALGRDVRELFDLQHGSVALDAGSAEGVDETLQDEETDRIDARLQHDRNTQAHQQRPLSLPGVEITPFRQQIRENVPQIQETGDGGTCLCDHGRGSRAGDTHMKDGDKHTVQHDVQGGGDHQENECAARITVCPQDAIGNIVEQLENNSTAVDQKVCHTVETHFLRCLQKTENNWTGCQKAGGG